MPLLVIIIASPMRRMPHRITRRMRRDTRWATGLTPRRPYHTDVGTEQMTLSAAPADDGHYPPLPIIFMGRMSIMTIAPSHSLIISIVH